MQKAVEFNKAKPADGVNDQETSVSCLIANGVEVADKLVLGQAYTLFSPDDAKELGIDAAYDATNSVVLFHHIDEFYRAAGSGTKLYLMVVAKSVLPATILTDATFIYAKKLVAFAKGEAFQLAIAYNGAFTDQAPETLTDGISSNIRSAIAAAQDLALWCFDTERPLQVLLEGRSYGGNAGASANLRALVTGANIPLEADKVSVIIAQDYDYAESLAFASGKKYASVGLALGVLASIRINQNIGEVETLNLTDAIRGNYVTAGLSSHTKVEEAEGQLVALDAKGYIFPVSYTGISGYRFNDDHVCTPVIIDPDGIMNEHSISLGRTLDFSIRGLRAAFTRKIKSVQPVDNTTGLLPLGVVKSFNKLGDTVFEDMKAAGLISGGKTVTDPTSDLLTGEKALIVDQILQPTGTVNKIKSTISIKKSI